MQTFYQYLFLIISINTSFILIIKLISVFSNYSLDSRDFNSYFRRFQIEIFIVSVSWAFFFLTINTKEMYVIRNSDAMPTIIWNDDLESIPIDNSLITLEFTKGDTIYIGPYDKNAKTE